MDNAQPFIGGEATFKKREAEMVKRLVCFSLHHWDFEKSFNKLCIADLEFYSSVTEIFRLFMFTALPAILLMLRKWKIVRHTFSLFSYVDWFELQTWSVESFAINLA